MTDLPTIEECVEFLRLINVGRVAIGEPELEYLDFDACEPGSTTNCLSAAHLFHPAGWNVGLQCVDERSAPANHAVLHALEMDATNPYPPIPRAILVVTSVFDRCTHDELVPLRERMVDAGVVA